MTNLPRWGSICRFVGKVRDMVRKNQFKRRPPLIAKLSNRTVNVGLPLRA